MSTTRIPRYLFTSRLAVTLVLALGGSAAVASPAETVAETTAETVTETAVDAAPGPAVAAAQDLAALRPAGAAADGSEAAARRWTDALPAAVVDALGYTPVTVDGMPADPAGDCSSPVPLPTSFTPACLTHDLGYDLLRVADATGERIPAGVRPALDRQLASRMVASCTGGPVAGAGCRLVAGVADAAVTANSVRQGDGAPVKEHWPWA